MAVLEQLVFDGLALNDVTTYRLQGLEISPPRKRYEWVQGADADGQGLVRDPLHENREITATIRLTPTTRDAALAAIGAIVDKLEEAEKQLDGLNLVWTPSSGTKAGTFHVLSGEITEIPIDYNGWLLRSPAPVITVVFLCDPFMYGEEVTLSSAASATPFLTLTAASIPGDVPAEGRLVVTDSATQNRRYVEWGLQQRHYDAATSLLIDSDNMVTSGYAGAGTTRTGAYDPNATGNSVIRATIYPPAAAVCGTGNLTHVGVFRVKARVYTTANQAYVRLRWADGGGVQSNNDWTLVHVNNAFCEIDLGLISVPPATLGAQRWSGDLAAYCTDTSATLDIDYLVLVPAGEGYGVARAAYDYPAGVIVQGDQFNSVVAGTALNARVASIGGGSWATSGATTDFAAADAPDLSETFSRATNADTGQGRFAVLGATNYTDTEVRVALYHTGSDHRSRVIARYSTVDNYAFAEINRDTVPTKFRMGVRVAGVETTVKEEIFGWNPFTWVSLRIVIYASGRIIAVIDQGNGPIAAMTGYHVSLATGGTLATGKPGFSDLADSGVATARYYEDFYVYTPGAEPLAIASTQSMEIRTDKALREDSTGTVWAEVPQYRGSGFYLPQAGSANRTSRLLIKAHRTDIETSESANVTDNVTAQVTYRPRWLAVPR